MVNKNRKRAGAEAKSAPRKSRAGPKRQKQKMIQAAKKVAKKIAKKEMKSLKFLAPDGSVPGAAQWLHSFFDSEHGIHRGLSSSGAPNTALSYQSSSFDLTVPAGTYLTLGVTPGTVYGARWITAAYGTGMVNPIKPNGTGANITNYVLSAPFNSINPSLTARVAHFSLTMQETTNVLNQGGVWNTAFFPEFSNAGMLAPADILPDFTIINFNSQKYNRQYNGINGQYNQPLLQWFPCDKEEMDFYSLTAQTDPNNNPYSGFGAIFYNPATAPISIRFTWKVGIEYNPTDDYRRFVETQPPLVHPTAPFELTVLVLEHWAKLALTTPGDLKNFMGAYGAIPGFNRIFNANTGNRAPLQVGRDHRFFQNPMMNRHMGRGRQALIEAMEAEPMMIIDDEY